jgi:hypothetical protein
LLAGIAALLIGQFRCADRPTQSVFQPYKVSLLPQPHLSAFSALDHKLVLTPSTGCGAGVTTSG